MESWAFFTPVKFTYSSFKQWVNNPIMPSQFMLLHQEMLMLFRFGLPLARAIKSASEAYLESQISKTNKLGD